MRYYVPRMHLPRALAMSAAVVIVTTACSSATVEPDTTIGQATATTIALQSVPANYAGYLHQTTACGAEMPTPAVDMKFDAPGDAGLTGTTRVTLHTSCGDIVIDLDPGLAPVTANSFVFLAESGFFDGTVSHRVIPGFMIQAGDPTATGMGGPGYTLPDEFPSTGSPYIRGVVAMANAGPGTTGSQFFIMIGDADWLGPQYTVIGSVSSGLDALDLIAEVPLGRSANSSDPNPSTPLESVYIESVTIER
jgi:cyclophilin family peptidyl-prolyl cis-trans isomerase